MWGERGRGGVRSGVVCVLGVQLVVRWTYLLTNMLTNTSLTFMQPQRLIVPRVVWCVCSVGGGQGYS